MCALNNCKIRFGNTHNCWSFKWDSASGCIDMMPFLLRSLHGERQGEGEQIWIRHTFDVTSSKHKRPISAPECNSVAVMKACNCSL